MADGDDWEEVDRQDGIPVEGGFVQLDLEGLAADTAWSVTVYAADGLRRAEVTRFRTALSDDDYRVVVFGATSCLGGNEPWRTLRQAADERLDFFCLLGDSVYADGSVSIDDYDMHWQYTMQQGGMRTLCASTSLVATWDDHEIDNNWSASTSQIEQKFTNGLDRFSAYLPRSPGNGPAGIWRKLAWGAVLDVFVLDCRSERQPERGIYISEEQMDWLKTGLSASTARFKVILNSVPITDLYTLFSIISVEDRWSGFDAQRTEILSHIVDNGIAGVLWVAGDVHFGAVATAGQTGQLADSVYEVIAGPGGSTPNIAIGLSTVVDEQQFSILLAEWNYTRIACDPGTGIVNVRFVDDDGRTLEEMDVQL
jgi:alkaline phosphatase D